MSAQHVILSFFDHQIYTMPRLLKFVLMSLFAVSNVAADGFIESETSYLTIEDISAIVGNERMADFEAKFGEPLRAEMFMGGWPKREHEEITEEVVVWKRAYWFFFKRNARGRPDETLGLEFIASVKDDIEDISPPLIGLIPVMTIDWPERLRGELLINQIN